MWLSFWFSSVLPVIRRLRVITYLLIVVVILVLLVPNRLNKIGKNPNLMSQKDDEISNPDESAINAVVNALAAVDTKEEK